MKKNTDTNEKVCRRGHRFEVDGPCPGCWPGYYKRRGLEIKFKPKK